MVALIKALPGTLKTFPCQSFLIIQCGNAIVLAFCLDECRSITSFGRSISVSKMGQDVLLRTGLTARLEILYVFGLWDCLII